MSCKIHFYVLKYQSKAEVIYGLCFASRGPCHLGAEEYLMESISKPAIIPFHKGSKATPLGLSH